MSEQPPNAGRGAASARSSDLLVIHAAADEWFVHGALLPAVVEPGHVVELSSRLPLGGVALAELARAIAASRVTVVVVSSAFLSDRLSSLASLWASHAAVREGPLVVPVLIEDVAAPLYLEARVMLDLRDRGRWQEGLRRLRGEVVGGEPRRGLDEDPQGDELACPYPGMRAFAASDVSDYFGREQEADELAARLRAGERELYVVGPSGSGKSSLVAAGLLPRIGKRRAGQQPPLVRTFRPGARPVHRLVTSLLSEPGAVAEAEAAILAGDGSWAAHALASALHQAADGASLLLFVDQLEELFALASAEEQARCIAALRHLREAPQVILVCTLRADFFGHLLQSELWRPGRTLHVPVAPLRREGLRASIVRPAERAGAWLEPGLVERLLADADEEPGTLPLLQETLVQLWDRRRHRVLTLADYQAMGDGERHGLAVVIARRADACLRALAPDEERVARRILLRLVSFGEGVADTRRQQSKAALGRGEVPERFEAALEALARQRVLRIDRTERNGDGGDGGEVLVDLAHEALLSAWPTLASLVRDRRKDEAQRRLLAAKVAEWEERRVSDASAGLLDTVELKEAEGYLARAPDPELGEVLGLAELVQHSRAEREAVVRQRDDARRLLAAQYQEAGRQYLLEGRAQRSIPFLVAARELAVNNAALGTLFHRATLVQETSTFWQRDPIKMMVLGADEELLIAVSKQRAEFWHLPSRRQVAVVSHQARITSTEVSRDGRLVVTTSEDRTACIWDARTGARLLAPLQHPDLVLAAAFDRSGEQLVTACWDGAVRIWDVVTGAPRQLPLWHGTGVTGVVIAGSASAPVIAAGCWDRAVRLWDVATGASLAPPLPHTGVVTAMDSSSSGMLLATGDAEGEVKIWDVVTGALVSGPLRHTGLIYCLAFSMDGTKVVSASADHTACVWDTVSGTMLGRPLRHKAGVTRAQFSPDGRRVVTASMDRTARLWDAQRGSPVCEPMEHAGAVASAALLHDGASVITASMDRTARLWAVSPLATAPTQCWPGGPVLAHCFAGNHAIAAVAVGSDAVRVWSARAGSPLCPELAHPQVVNSAAFDRRGASLVTACADGFARVWNVEQGALRGAPLDHGAPVLRAGFSGDGKRVLTVGADRRVCVWQGGRLVCDLAGHDELVLSAILSGDGTRLATASWDKTARTWDVERAQQLACVRHGEVVLGAQLSPDGSRLVTASWDKTARIWDAHSGQPLTPPLRHGDVVVSAVFDPTGALVVTACEDASARLWDATTGREVTPPMEHEGAVRQAWFGPRGARVLTASMDRTAALWDVASGKLLLPPLEHDDEVVAASFSEDGESALTITRRGELTLWDVAADHGSTEQWQEVERRGSYSLRVGVLLVREGPGDEGTGGTEGTEGIDG